MVIGRQEAGDVSSDHLLGGGTKQAQASDTKDLVVTTKPLPVGTTIKPGDVKTIRVPVDQFPKGAYAKVEEVLDRPIISNILQNERVRKAVEARAGPGPPIEVKQQVRQLNLFTCAVIGFATAGAFLSAAYYPHIFVLTGMLIAARAMALARFGLKWALVTPVNTKRRPGLQRPAGQQR